MHTVHLTFSTSDRSTGGYDPTDSWSRDSTASTWSIEGYTVDKPDYSYNTESANVASVDGNIFAVVVDYDTGNSFGRDTGQYCFIDAFSDEKKAHALADAIAKDANKDYCYNGGNNVTYINDAGETVIAATYTWKGYFEHFNYCRVVTVSQGREKTYYRD